jgi:hypothetical protein
LNIWQPKRFFQRRISWIKSKKAIFWKRNRCLNLISIVSSDVIIENNKIFFIWFFIQVMLSNLNFFHKKFDILEILMISKIFMIFMIFILIFSLRNDEFFKEIFLNYLKQKIFRIKKIKRMIQFINIMSYNISLNIISSLLNCLFKSWFCLVKSIINDF